MNNLTDVSSNKGILIACTNGVTNFTSELLNAIPLALAAPILAYQRTKTQKELLEIAIEAKRRERTEILRTLQILAKYGQLTPELSQQLMVAYYQQPY